MKTKLSLVHEVKEDGRLASRTLRQSSYLRHSVEPKPTPLLLRSYTHKPSGASLFFCVTDAIRSDHFSGVIS